MSLAEDREWSGFVRRWMLLSLALHLVTAYFSQGYHSADEYFQILEFLNYKLGGTPVNDLAVEFPERMRPWMQPFLYFGMVRGWKALGITSPFTWALSFRVLTGLIGWASTYAIALRARDWFSTERARHFAVVTASLLWFLPSLHVRPSSESLAGSAFLLALALLDWLAQPRPGLARPPSEKVSYWSIGGALLGLSFEARFQSGFMVAGLMAWLMFRAGLTRRQFFGIAAGFALVFAVGRWIDRWGYGEWVISPWNYVQYNLIRGEVNRYGQAPWWDVFRMSFTESWPFLGLGLAIASILAWIRHPLHVLSWSLIPFFLVHEFIAHKELRFFFPIAMAGPALLTLSLVSRKTGRLLDLDQIRGVRWAWRFLIANNLIALVALCFVPYSRTAQFYEGVSRLISPDTQRFEIFYEGRDPYRVLGNPVYFYRHPAIVTTAFTRFDEVAAKMQADPSAPVWLFSQKFELPAEAASIAQDCEPAYRTLPVWTQKLDVWNWLERANAWTLFRCQKKH